MLLLGFLANAAGAQSLPAVDFVAPGSLYTDSSYSMGWEFNLTSPTTVTGLGFFDDLQDGLLESHDVGIFDAAGNLLVSTTVMPTDPLSGQFRYRSIVPYGLPAGTGYRIAAVTGSERYAYSVGPLTLHPRVQFVTDRWTPGATSLVFPTITDSFNASNGGYFGPNFLAQVELTDGLAGLWRFDNVAGNYGIDSSGAGRNLNIVGSPGFPAGLYGSGLDLHHNAGQYAVRGVDDDAFDFGGGDFTLQTWVDFHPSGYGGEQTLIEKFTGASGPGWTLTSFGDGSQYQFYSSLGGLTATAPVAGGRHHIVVSRSAGTLAIFQDGITIASASVTGAIADTSAPLLIGKRNSGDGNDYSLDGQLDDTAIWNRGLSAGEIKKLYNHGVGYNFSGPQTTFWEDNTGDHDWDNANNWSVGAPQAGDTARVENGGTATISTPTEPLSRLSISGGQTADTTVNINANVTADYVRLGEYSNGLHRAIVNQSAGTTLEVSQGYLAVGDAPGTDAEYNLNGGTIHLVPGLEMIVGYRGQGTFNNNSGTLQLDSNLWVGADGAQGNGVFNNNAGTVTMNLLVVYSTGLGAFNQDGGAVAVQESIAVGSYASSSSVNTYQISSGTLDATENIFLVGRNVSLFRQTGGVVNADDVAFVSDSADFVGSLDLIGGTMNLAGEVVDNASNGTSSLYLDGGTLTIGGGQITVDVLNVGNASGRVGSHTMISGQTTTVNQIFTIGNEGQGTFIQTGGSVVTGTLSFGAQSTGIGTYQLQGGSLQVTGDVMDGSGRGTLYMDGGTLSVGGSQFTIDRLYLGQSAGSNAAYNVPAGQSLVATETLIVGHNGMGTLTLNGGSITHQLGDWTRVGHSQTAEGTLRINSGTFLTENPWVIGNQGVGRVNQTGGTARTNSYLLIGGEGTGNGRFDIVSGQLHVPNGHVFIGDVQGTGNLIVAGTADVRFDRNLYLGIFGGIGFVAVQGGSLEVAGDMFVGENGGLGLITQTGGNVQVGGYLALSTNADYRLIGGSLLVTGHILDGVGDSRLNIDGGMLVAGGQVTVDQLNVGNDFATIGLHSVTAGHSVTANDVLRVGRFGSGTLIQQGGVVTTRDLQIAVGPDAQGTFSLLGGVLNMNGGGITTGAGSSQFRFEGGALLNAALIGLTLVNAGGTLEPGAPTGRTLIQGDYTQTALGTYHAELAGISPGSEHDQLSVSGAANLAGRLSVELMSGFQPALGDAFTILTYASRTGVFETLDLPTLPLAGLFWSLDYRTTELSLSVSAVPGDINLDGNVDRSDAALFATFFGLENGATWNTGDFDGDFAVTLNDLALLQAYFGQGPLSPSAAAVPEPSALLMLLSTFAVAVVARPLRRCVPRLSAPK